MHKKIITNEINEILNNISLSAKRLEPMIEYVQMENINFINKIIMCSFIKEISHNINIEAYNALLLIKKSKHQRV